MEMEELTARVVDLLMRYGLNVVAALLIFFVGRWAAKIFRHILRRQMQKHEIDPTLTSFTVNLSYALLLTFVVVAAINKLGIQTASFIAIIGAAGLAIGLALQGSLSNFASGVLMLVFKPFSVGQVIEGGGVLGIVEEIDIFTTKMKTFDNKAVIVPNTKIMSDTITNFSAKDTKRLEIKVGVGYDDDLKKVQDVLMGILKEDERILEDPAPFADVVGFADSSITFAIRPWVKASDFWNVNVDLHKKIKQRFDEEGISIPFPQRDVHLYKVRSKK